MVNLYRAIKQERIKKLKESTKPVDGGPLLKFILEEVPKMSDMEKEKFKKSIEAGFVESGKVFLKRAFAEKILTKNEWKGMVKKYSFTESGFSSVLQAVFNKKDGHIKKSEKIYLITIKDTATYKARKFLSKRFGVEIITGEELLEQKNKEVKK